MREPRAASRPLAGLVVVVLLAGCAQPTPSSQPPASSSVPATPSPSGTSTPLATSTPPATPTAAPRSIAEVGVVGVGDIPRGGTSGETLALTFAEGSATAFANAPGSFRVTLTDEAGVGTTVSFAGTPSTKASPGSLRATASVFSNVLVVDIVGSDPLNIEPITVTGLGINVSSAAAVGPLHAVMSDFSGSLAAGPIVFSTGGPASGTIATVIGARATSVTVELDPGTCSFIGGGQVSFGTSPESVPLLAVTAGPGAGRETLAIGPTGAPHLVGDTVRGARACGGSTNLASPGAVVSTP